MRNKLKDKRVKSRFLFSKKTIGGETRWLCYTTWTEEWNAIIPILEDPEDPRFHKWSPIH